MLMEISPIIGNQHLYAMTHGLHSTQGPSRCRCSLFRAPLIQNTRHTQYKISPSRIHALEIWRSSEQDSKRLCYGGSMVKKDEAK
ncbi:hypothetical protein VNO77_04215 [Canavalia gladiata]|uniref:Uncharacterized protein n=1 Tax=Canavalia gladiata TaxID=3824 RepID=A0AAN9MW82_CANGL